MPFPLWCPRGTFVFRHRLRAEKNLKTDLSGHTGVVTRAPEGPEKAPRAAGVCFGDRCSLTDLELLLLV
ncbi:hypothetical protein MBHK15_110817 [Marinobacter salarius]|nr:hypothetical protein MBHK15_110817 [Marinobacter salarius]